VLDQCIIDKAVEEWQRDFEHVWLQVEDSLNTTFIISDILYRNFQTELFEILLFC